MTTDRELEHRRQLILIAAMPFGRMPEDHMVANCHEVLRGAMRRAGVWTDGERMLRACQGAPEFEDRTFTLWYSTLIEMTRSHPNQVQFLDGGGNLDLPAGARFTSCHLTRAGHAAAMDAIDHHPDWPDEPAES